VAVSTPILRVVPWLASDHGGVILLISGSTRPGSTNTAALQALAGPSTVEYRGLVELPAFVPGAEPPPVVASLIARIAEADGVLFCTPEYAGTLPGSLKNLLDWTVGAGVLDGKPVGSINIAAPGRGEGAQATLRMVLGYLNARFVEPAWARVFVPREAVDVDGNLSDESVAAELRTVLDALQRGAAAD
jgi:chromate reductase, NAD(P)H dehydrogenase (quinone)